MAACHRGPNRQESLPGRHSVERLVGPRLGRQLRDKSSAPEEHARRPPSGQSRHFRCSERKEAAGALDMGPARTTIQSPARESTYYTRVGKCVAPGRAPTGIPGTPYTSDQTPENTSRAPGRKEWLLNLGHTLHVPSA